LALDFIANGRLRQKLPLAGSKSNFRFTPESRLNLEIAACPFCADFVEKLDC